MSRPLLVLCLFLAACEGECTSVQAARVAIGPTAVCGSDGNGLAICIADGVTYMCSYTGTFTYVAKCAPAVSK